VLPEKHRAASRASISLAELDNEPFLLLKEGHCFRDSVIAACDKARMSPSVVFESGQFATILAMVSSVYPQCRRWRSNRSRGASSFRSRANTARER